MCRERGSSEGRSVRHPGCQMDWIQSTVWHGLAWPPGKDVGVVKGEGHSSGVGGSRRIIHDDLDTSGSAGKAGI